MGARWNEAEDGRINMAELCRMFGQSGDTWVSRYREANFDPGAVTERSRRPKTSPYAITPELEDRIVAARKLHPHWGRVRLVEANPGKPVPSASSSAVHPLSV
ncbi:MAG TPA: helix-turn-helix domain-containing protein [Kofleriaceae bacterium]|nr:helix-turn-helix domain-containing protein [Kofleriaceae bacterium]